MSYGCPQNHILSLALLSLHLSRIRCWLVVCIRLLLVVLEVFTLHFPLNILVKLISHLQLYLYHLASLVVFQDPYHAL